MSLHPRVKLSELRRIGWRDWDPIGLSDGSDFGPECCANEYDRYLLHVVSMLCRGESREAASEYLDGIASVHMGLGASNDKARAACKRTTDSIAAHLKELPDSPRIAD